MDFELKPPEPKENNHTAVIVLCCMSESYFGQRLRDSGCRPLLMTQQLMYPGSFILDAAIAGWIRGKSTDEIRASAGQAYAKNQKISIKAATGVFAPPRKDAAAGAPGQAPTPTGADAKPSPSPK